MGSSDSNVWHQVHAQREDGVAAMFLIRDVVPRADQPKIFVVELPYPVTDLSGQPDAAGYRRLGAFQDQWLEPACAALGWTFVAWKCEDGSFFLYLYGSGDPEALLDKLAPFDGELGFFNDLDADWSEYAALRDLVEQAEAAEGDHGHVHGEDCDHEHVDGEDRDHEHVHGEDCDHEHHVHGEGCDHDHGHHDHGDRSPDRIAAPHAIEVIDLTGDTPTRTWVRPGGTGLDGDDGDGAARPDVPELAADTARTPRRRRDTAPRTANASRSAAPTQRADAADQVPRRRSRTAATRPSKSASPPRPRAKRSTRAASPRKRPGRGARRASAAAAPTAARGTRTRPGAAKRSAKRPAKRSAAAAPKAARLRAARDTDGPAPRSPRSSAAASSGGRGAARATPAKRAASTSAIPARAPRRRTRRTR